jgi:hypothetical protein
MFKKTQNQNYCFLNGILFVFTTFFLSFSVYAGDVTGLKNGDFLQKSAISKDRVLIRDKNYKTKGYLQPSVIDPRKTVLYDTDGKPVGYFEKDVLDNRKVKFYQTRESKKAGNLKIDFNKGYLQQSVIDSRKTILYNSDDSAKGYFSKDVLDSRKFRFHEKK